MGIGGGVNGGAPFPEGVGEPEGVVDIEGTAVFGGVDDTRIAVKQAGEGIVHCCMPVFVNTIEIVTSLLIALGLMATGKTASPSEVVVVAMVSDVPSGHCIVAVAVAPPIPTGLPSTI